MKKGAFTGLLAIVAVVLILVKPDFVQLAVGIFLIVWGALVVMGKS
jgi:hypothetical protein